MTGSLKSDTVGKNIPRVKRTDSVELERGLGCCVSGDVGKKNCVGREKKKTEGDQSTRLGIGKCSPGAL